MNRAAARSLTVDAIEGKESIVIENASGKVLGFVGDDGIWESSNVTPYLLLSRMIADPARHAGGKDARLNLVKAANRLRIRAVMKMLFS
jgi:hypothetical protein